MKNEGSDCVKDDGVIEYGAGNVVLLRCDHVREMRGETEELIRRTRSEGAENGVLMAVRDCGVEPDWFVERWVDAKGALVACVVFDDEGKTGRFVDAVRAVSDKWVDAGGKGGCPVSIYEDDALREEVAKLFTEELRRRRAEQMAKWSAVVKDADESGKWAGRIVVGEFDACGGDGECKSAKEAFDGVRAAIENASRACNSEISYTGYWNGSVARFAFCFDDCEKCEDAKEELNAIGALFYDPIEERPDIGVELEMTALVIADAQRREREAEMMREASDSIAGAAAEGVGEAVGKRVTDIAEAIARTV